MNVKKKLWIIVPVAISLLSVSCEFRKNLPSCKSFLKEKAQNRFLLKDASPVAFDRLTKIKWYRCSAGQIFVENKCEGEPLKLTWLEAASFAREFSESSGEKWKVAQYWQLRELQRDDCINPALDTRVFPNLEIFLSFILLLPALTGIIAVNLYITELQVFSFFPKNF